VNGFVYKFVGFILQTAQAHNVTIPGGQKYNVPSGNFTIDEALLSQIGAIPSPNLTSYTPQAIAGADDFNDGNTAIRDVFDMIVKNTQEVTPTCEFRVIYLVSIHGTDPSPIKLGLSGVLGTHEGCHFMRMHSNDSFLSYNSYGWPVRTVEKLPPYNPTKLKNPVLVIGNSVRLSHLLNLLPLTTLV